MIRNENQGIPIVWDNAVTNYAISLSGLLNGKGRCGVVGNFGDTRAPKYALTAEVNMDSAPTAGETVEIYWAGAHDRGNLTTLPGGATGTDVAYKDGEEDEWKKQLQFVGAVVLTNDSDGTVQRQTFVFSPPFQWGCPVVINKSGVTFEGDEDSHKLILTPIWKT